MTTIHNAYVNALLADATYAFDDKIINGLTSSDLTEVLDERMTPVLAKYIGDNFEVVTHVESSDIFGSGFDATVWRDLAGKTYVSMQGSTGLADFSTDLDLTVSGIARTQLEDMVNWWLKNTTPVGEIAQQIKLDVGVFIPDLPTVGTGILSDVTNVSVNGHSLGGHLTTAFVRIFGNKWPVDHSYTYNGAGFTPTSEIFFDNIASILGDDVGLGRFPHNNEQSNFFAQNGINLTTQNLFNGQIGRRIALFNEESANPINNHFMYKLSDALALGDMLSKVDSSFDITKMNSLLEASSNLDISSLENILDALRVLLIGRSITETPLGDVSDSNISRVVYHEHLNELKEALFVNSNELELSLKPKYKNLQIVNVTSLSDSAALDNAEGLAYRYALTELNTFALTGNTDLYNVEELKAENFSEKYLTDRAQFLSLLIAANFEDKPYVQLTQGSDHLVYKRFDGGELTDQFALLNQDDLNTPNNPGLKIIAFSDNGSEEISLDGFDQDDRLYGGSGNDTINGNDGDDYIEGSAGNDTLIGGKGIFDILDGGAGNDSYIFNTGDEQMTIRDSDMEGSITIKNGADETVLGAGDSIKQLATKIKRVLPPLLLTPLPCRKNLTLFTEKLR